MTKPDETLHLRFMGDWGAFNLSRICGWMAWQVGVRTGAQSHVIHTGRGMGDNITALHRGEVDVAVATPAGFAVMAQAGLGPHAGEAMPELRAIGCVPHEDALLFAVRAEHGIHSMADLRDAKPKLRLSLSPDDGESYVGLGAAATLRASGIEPEAILSWGGEFLYGENPMECLEKMLDESADAVIFEAMMTPWWHELAEKFEINFLDLEEDAAQRIHEELLLSTQTVPAGYLRGMEEAVKGIDFGGWLVLTTDELDPDVAELLAQILVESSRWMEQQYAHIPSRFSPLTGPITPDKLAATPIALHPGAAHYYRSIGIALSDQSARSSDP